MQCCVQCEIEKAKQAALYMKACGDDLLDIAVTLCQRFGASYYLEGLTLYRANTVPPHMPYKVHDFS
jgi:hypothetical protein